jgi:acyl carrier protein
MYREQILNVVVKNLKLNVDGLDDTTIDGGRSMAEYGATSLDIVEIVNASMRDLKVSVPRTQLDELTSIDALVDLFLTLQPPQ